MVERCLDLRHAVALLEQSLVPLGSGKVGAVYGLRACETTLLLELQPTSTPACQIVSLQFGGVLFWGYHLICRHI